MLATPETLAIMDDALRSAGGQAIAYGESIRVGEVDVRFVPAGHVLGSAQIVMEHKGERIVVSGDYKRRPDPTCAPFVPVPCDMFVTEATFGLPVFRHPGHRQRDRPAAASAARRSRAAACWSAPMRWARRSGSSCELRARGHDEPIYVHGAVERLCRLYEELGVTLGELRPATGATKDGDWRARSSSPRRARSTTAGARRLPDPVTAMASGWMRIRQRARQRNVELPLIISDHADWDELTTTIASSSPARCGSPTAARKRSSIGA